jgi:hypothetical protein
VPPEPPFDLDAFARLLGAQLARLLRTEVERLIGRTELAKRIGVCERSIGPMVARRELPPPLLHTAGLARWEWGQVVKYLEARQGKRHRRGRGRYDRPEASSNGHTE